MFDIALVLVYNKQLHWMERIVMMPTLLSLLVVVTNASAVSDDKDNPGYSALFDIFWLNFIQYEKRHTDFSFYCSATEQNVKCFLISWVHQSN